MICDGCGAPYKDAEPKCPFCGRLRAEGRAQLAAEAERSSRREEGEASRLRQAAQTTVDRCAKQSMYWALGGLPLCFIPICGVVAMVLSLRAKSLAKRHGLIAPAKSTVGLVVGALQVLVGGGAIVGANWLSEEHEERKQALAAELGDAPKAQALSPRTACAIAELHLVTEGFDGVDDQNIEGVRCPGRLVVTGNTATLEDVRFSKRRCAVTLRYGSEWAVESILGGSECRKRDAHQQAPASDAVNPESDYPKPASGVAKPASDGTSH